MAITEQLLSSVAFGRTVSRDTFDDYPGLMTQAKSAMVRGEGRESLIRATVDVVAEVGLSGASFRKIAAKAGVANTLIPHYFGTRKALLMATMEWVTEQTLLMADISSEEVLKENFAEIFVDRMTQKTGIQVFQYEMMLASRRDDDLRRHVQGLYERYMTQLAQGLGKQGIKDPDATARIVFAALDGLTAQLLTFADQDTIRHSIIHLGKLLREDTPPPPPLLAGKSPAFHPGDDTDT